MGPGESERDPRAFLHERCPRSDYDWVDRETGEVVGALGCKAYHCEVCGPRKLWLTTLALSYVQPSRFVTLTWAPEDREQRRRQMFDLAKRVRKAGYRWEVAWATEMNPRGTGFHIHALHKGDYIAQRRLQELWGDRIVHITALDQNAPIASAYLLKQGVNELRAAGYTLKQAEASSRPVHLSRGYCGEGRTLEDARREVREFLHPENGERRWFLRRRWSS